MNLKVTLKYLGTNEVSFKSPSSQYSSKTTHISAKLHNSSKRKHLQDLDKSGSKIEHKSVTSQNNPKTMSSLTTRYLKTNPSPSNRTDSTHDAVKPVAKSLLNYSHEISHNSNKSDSKEPRKLSPMNVSAILKESSKFTINK